MDKQNTTPSAAFISVVCILLSLGMIHMARAQTRSASDHDRDSDDQIEIGAGTYIDGDEARLLLSAEYEGIGGKQVRYFQVKAEAIAGELESRGGFGLQELEIEVEPVSFEVWRGSQKQDLRIEALPGVFGRELELGVNQRVQVEVVGVEFEREAGELSPGQLEKFGELALRAVGLGYFLLDDTHTFQGTQVAGVEMEGGIGKGFQKFTVRLSGGFEGGYARGDTACMINSEVFTELAVGLRERFSFFSRVVYERLDLLHSSRAFNRGEKSLRLGLRMILG